MLVSAIVIGTFAVLSVFGQGLPSVSTNPVEGLRTKTVRLVAFTNATIIPEPGRLITNGVLIVRDHRIVNVGRDLPIPAAAVVYDLKGAWVYPGFIDPFTDVADVSKGDRSTKSDDRGWREEPTTPPQQGAHHWNQAVRPERRVSEMLRIPAKTAATWNAEGFTGAVVASHDGIFSGSAAAVTLKPGSASDVVLSDNVAQMLDTRKGSSETPYPSSLMGSIALLRQTFMDADWYGKALAMRSTPTAKVPDVNLSLQALHQAMQNNSAFVAVSYDEHDLFRWNAIAAEANIRLIHRGTGLEYRRLQDVARLKPTIILTPDIPQTPDVRNPIDARSVALQQLIHWYWAADNPRLLDSVGCTLAFTTNGLKDRSEFLDNIRTYVQRGLSKTTALAALTTVPASIAGVADRVGTLAPNKLANFVILSDELWNKDAAVQGVVVEGTYVPVDRPATVDIRGTWTLSAPGAAATTITIGGTAEKPTINAERDSMKLTATIQRSEQRCSFTLSDSDLDGVLRATAMADSILMRGEMVLPNGSTVPFTLQRDSAFVPTPAEPPVVQARRALPAMLPLGPFGMDSVPAQAAVILKNATVWTSSPQGVLTNADVHIAGGKIVAVGKSLSGAPTVDCTGMHITPGLIDEHSHIAIDRGVNEGTHAITTEVRIGDVVNPDDVNIYRQLAGGVTSTHLLHGSANPMGGQLQFIRMRWGANADGLRFTGVKPTVKFALGENVKQSNWGDRYTVRYPQTRMGVEEIMRDAFQAAREYEQERTAASVGGPPVRRDLQLDALVEILNGDRLIHCHSYKQSEILMLMRLAEEFGFRVHTFTHILEGYKVAREMATHGAMASSFADWWAYKFEVYDAIPENPAIMHEQGVTVSINSDDAEMARRLNQEAGKSISYGGVSPDDAITFVTRNAARQMDALTTVGTLEAGKDADVVVWSGNPLSSMSRVERTYVEGRLYFSRELDQQLRTRDAELRSFLEQQALKAGAAGAPTVKMSGRQRREYHCDDIDDHMSNDVSGTAR